MSDPIVSVIVPVHDLAHYLDKTMKSILAQAYEDFEVILVDDHSLDGSWEIEKKWEAADPRVRLFVLPQHQGVSKARNFGIDQARGEYLAFVDGDDQLLPQYLKTMADCMEEDIAMVAVGYHWGTWHAFDEKLTQKYQVFDRQKMFRRVNTYGDPVGGYVWNKLFRKSVMDSQELRFREDLKLGEDLWFTAEYIAQAPQSKFVFNPVVLYQKINRPDSTIHRATSEMREKERELRQAIDEMGRHLSK